MSRAFPVKQVDQPELLFPDEKLDTCFLMTAAVTLSFKLLSHSSLVKLVHWRCGHIFKGNKKYLKMVRLYS